MAEKVGEYPSSIIFFLRMKHLSSYFRVFQFSLRLPSSDRDWDLDREKEVTKVRESTEYGDKLKDDGTKDDVSFSIGTVPVLGDCNVSHEKVSSLTKP